jgi:hypothetical protein
MSCSRQEACSRAGLARQGRRRCAVRTSRALKANAPHGADRRDPSHNRIDDHTHFAALGPPLGRRGRSQSPKRSLRHARRVWQARLVALRMPVVHLEDRRVDGRLGGLAQQRRARPIIAHITQSTLPGCGLRSPQAPDRWGRRAV